MRNFLGSFLSRFTFPAQYRFSAKNIAHFREAELHPVVQNAFNVDVTPFKVGSAGETLDGLCVMPKPLVEQDVKAMPAILMLNGYDSCYEESIVNLQTYAQRLQLPFYSFNYRGVVKSTGATDTSASLVEDAVAAVKAMIAKGHPANKIVILGHSLGGGIGAEAAAQLHQEGLKVKLYSDRSFASFTRAALGMKIKPAFVFGLMVILSGLVTLGLWAASIPFALSTAAFSIAAISTTASVMTALFPTLMRTVFKPLVWVILALSGWNIKAQKAYTSLPEEDKSYAIAKSPTNNTEKTKWDGSALHVTNERDHSVTDEASLHAGLKEHGLHSKNLINAHPAVTLTWEHLKHDVKLIRDPSKNTEQSCHSAGLDNMLCRYSGVSGLDRFVSFVEHTTRPSL